MLFVVGMLLVVVLLIHAVVVGMLLVVVLLIHAIIGCFIVDRYVMLLCYCFCNIDCCVIGCYFLVD